MRYVKYAWVLPFVMFLAVLAIMAWIVLAEDDTDRVVITLEEYRAHPECEWRRVSGVYIIADCPKGLFPK